MNQAEYAAKQKALDDALDTAQHRFTELRDAYDRAPLDERPSLEPDLKDAMDELESARAAVDNHAQSSPEIESDIRSNVMGAVAAVTIATAQFTGVVTDVSEPYRVGLQEIRNELPASDDVSATDLEHSSTVAPNPKDIGAGLYGGEPALAEETSRTVEKTQDEVGDYERAMNDGRQEPQENVLATFRADVTDAIMDGRGSQAYEEAGQNLYEKLAGEPFAGSPDELRDAVLDQASRYGQDLKDRIEAAYPPPEPVQSLDQEQEL